MPVAIRELAFQISEQVEALGASIGVKCGEQLYCNLLILCIVNHGFSALAVQVI